MRVEANQFDLNSIVIKKDDAIEVQNVEISKSAEVEQPAELDIEGRCFITILNDKETMLKSIDDKAYIENQKEQIKELQNLCTEVAAAMSVENYDNLQQEGIAPEKLTPYHLKCCISEHHLSANLSSEDELDEESKIKIKKALELSKSIENLSMDQIYSLVKKEIKPTIENIYKEQHMPSLTKVHSRTNELDEKTWQELQPYAKKAISEAGYEVNEENLKISRDLIECEIPVSKETITEVIKLKELKENYTQEAVLPKVVESVRNGQEPVTTNVTLNTREEAEKLVDKIKNIKEETVVSACRKEEPLTIQKLYEQQDIVEVQGEKEVVKDEITEFEHLTEKEIAAKRQLEEIRLKMTLEASTKLLKKGIEIETEELSRVVEELRRLETEHYKEVLKSSEVMVSEQNVRILAETSKTLYELASTPSYLLGQTYFTRETETLASLELKGAELKNQFIKASMAYEPLLTTPDAEYHDSIQKAFAHMDSLLEELEIEPTVENKRAVKILAYNEMELSSENIEGVKQYDAKVVNLVQNLKPFVTVEFIKQGINPIDLPIDELNQKVTEILEQNTSTPEESYAKFLYRLDQNKEITAEDREAYIGVYRLLHQVEKSDGKALGRVIKAGQEVTLKNMLTAVRSTRAEQKEYVVDDEQGMLYAENASDKDIINQINQGYETGKLASEMENVSNLRKQVETLPTVDDTVRKAFLSGEKYSSQSTSVWELLKEVPLEDLIKELETIKQGKEYAMYESEVSELREILKNSNSALSFLHKLNIPSSAENIKYVSQMFGQYQTDYNKAKKSKNTDLKENLSILLKKMGKLSDTLVDKSEMQSTYDELERSMDDMIDTFVQKEHPDTESIRLLSGIHSQISFARRLSSKESFYIPVETETSVANMNVTILRNSVKEGKLFVSVHSEDYGTIRINMKLNKNTVTGHVEGDNRAVLSSLSREKNTIKNLLAKEEVELKQLTYCFEPHVSQNDIVISTDGKDNVGGNGKQAERILYQLAKEMVKEVTCIFHELDTSTGKQ